MIDVQVEGLPSRLSFEDGTPDNVIQSTVKKAIAEQRTSLSAGATLKFAVPGKTFDTGIPLGQTATEALAGAGRRLSNIFTLGNDPFATKQDTTATQALNSSLPAMLGGAGADLAVMMGGGAALRGVGAIPALARAAPGVASAIGTAGQALMAPQTWGQAAAVPALYTAATTPGGGADRLTAGAGAGLTSLAGYGILKGIGQAISPKPPAEGAQELAKAGVKITPGQAIGGIPNTLEQKATSLPLVGDLIAKARRGSIESFDVATANKVLEPLGITVPPEIKAGRPLMNFTDEIINGSYANVKGQIIAPVDQALVTDMRAATSNVPQSMRGDFKEFVAKVIKDNTGRSADGYVLLGDNFKKAVTEIGSKARSYKASGIASERDLGYALDQVRSALTSAAQRASSPEASAGLKAADQAHAMWLRMEGAAAMTGAKEGVFTPSQLLNQVKKFAPGVRDKSFALGSAPMQDFASAAQRVIGDTYPDSGTAGRMLLNLGTLGLLGGGAAADQAFNEGKGAKSVGGMLSNPMMATGLATAAALYTPQGQAALRAMLARPQVLQPVLQDIRQGAYTAAPYAGLLGTAAYPLINPAQQ